MYLWKTEALATELKGNTLSQRERFKYLFLTMFFYSLCDFIWQSNLFDSDSEPVTAIDIGINASYGLIFLIALYLCYRINRTGDDRDIIARFTCLLIPLSFRLFSIILPLMLPPFIMLALMDDPDAISDTTVEWYFNGVSFIAMIWLYWRLLYWFRWVSHENPDALRQAQGDRVP